MGLIDQDDPGSPPLLRPATSPRRRRALRKLGFLALAALLVSVFPTESGGLLGALHRHLRDATAMAVRTVDRLSWATVSGHLRTGLRECRYDWRLRCIPTPTRLARTTPVPPPPAPSPVTRKLAAGQTPTSEDHAEARRLAEAAADRRAAFQRTRAAWDADRQAVAAYERSEWRRLEPVLVWPGAVAHALRQAAAEGWPSVAAVGLAFLLGGAVLTLLPFGAWSWLLLPAAALGVSLVLGRLLDLTGRLLDWPGQLLLLLDLAFTSWRLLADSRERVEDGQRLWRWFRRRARPTPAPADLPRWP